MSVLHLLALLLTASLPSLTLSKKASLSLSTPVLDPESLENVCDLITQVQTMYCYCDHLDKGDGTTANCLIYNAARPDDIIWDTFYHQPNLQQLTLNLKGNGSMSFVPNRVFKHTRHLYIVEIKNAVIADVAADSFGRSSSISDIDMSRNSVEKLERHAFAALTNLTKLTLSENKLADINRHVFVDLPELHQLFLDRNHITRIRNGAFSELDHLKDLELYSNRLKQLSRGTFKGLKKLQRVDLHRNHLSVIGDRTFAELPELKDLDLSENHIKYIGHHGFQGVPKLMRLNLQDNKLKALLPGTLQHTLGLFYINLGKNRLETVEEGTFRPIYENMQNIIMYFYIGENKLQCDCRLGWLQRLRMRTASAHVQAALDAATCEISGKVEDVSIIGLEMSELPCDLPLAEEPAPKEELSQEPAPVQESMQEQQKLRTLSSPPEEARASAQITAAAPATEGEVKVKAAGVTGRGGGSAAVAVQASLMLLTLLPMVVR